MNIAFLGQGIMGRPMSLNLLKAGHSVKVWNRNPDKCADAVEAGASQARTPQEAAQSAEAVILMLTGPEACDKVLFGSQGAAGGLKSGNTVINMSTVPPAFSLDLARRLKQTGANFLDAPVAGSRKPAEDATLLVLAGGDAQVVERMQPAFGAMSKRTIHCGPIGTGSTMKMANNLLLGVMIAGLAEAIGLGVKGGLGMETILEVLRSGPMANALFAMKEDMFRQGEFPAQFPLKHMAKDLRFAAQTASDAFAQTPTLNTVLNLYEKALNQGLADNDFAAIAKLLG